MADNHPGIIWIALVYVYFATALRTKVVPIVYKIAIARFRKNETRPLGAGVPLRNSLLLGFTVASLE